MCPYLLLNISLSISLLPRESLWFSIVRTTVDISAFSRFQRKCNTGIFLDLRSGHAFEIQAVNNEKQLYMNEVTEVPRTFPTLPGHLYLTILFSILPLLLLLLLLPWIVLLLLLLLLLMCIWMDQTALLLMGQHVEGSLPASTLHSIWGLCEVKNNKKNTSKNRLLSLDTL